MFEVLSNHESREVKEIVIKQMKEHFPPNQKSSILDLWITHPLPIMEDFVKETIETIDIDTAIKSAVYVMLDDTQNLMEIDPDFHYLDSYIRTVDPLLGSLLIQKVEQLKNPELNADFVPLEEDDDLSLMDRIRKRDFSYLWEHILDYPLPFIAELLRILNEEEWSPVDQAGLELFEILIEQIGTKGWHHIERCKWVVLSKKEGSQFIPISRSEIDRGDINLQFSQDLVARPDRIMAQKFKSRGRFALTNPQLGLNIYMKSVRKSEFDDLLHVPIYASNGVELAEFTIPVSSDKNFAMDEDGLYFSVKNKEGTYSVDLDALSAFLLPISRHTELVNDMVPILLERATEEQKLPLTALNLLSTMHRGREFELWDLKKQTDWDDDKSHLRGKGCLCTLSIDVGNNTTKVAQVMYGDCEHDLRTWEFPTIIYYTSPDNYIVGQEVIDKNLADTSQTFQNIKASLKYGARRFLRIQNSIISAYDAYRDYLLSIIEMINQDLDYSLNSIALSFPLHAPSGFEAWLRSILQEEGYERIELIDELSASILGAYRLHNQRGNVLLIDMGSSQIGIAAADMETNKSRKRLEEARIREDFEYAPEITTKISLDKGSLEITEMMFNTLSEHNFDFHEVFYLLEKTKISLSKDFKADFSYEDLNQQFSLNEGEGINIDQVFSDSDFYKSFKVLLRNAMMKAHVRGIPKEKLDTIMVMGGGSMWPKMLEYINQVFDGKEIILENDRFLTAKGVGLLANGQSLNMKLEEDILLRVAKNGIVGYETVASRGESILGKSKEFEIRPHHRMNQLVLDCWVRRPEFIPKEDVQPMKDSQNLGHTSETRDLFDYDRLFRKIVPLKGEANLKLNISSRGTLYFEIVSKDDQTLVSTDSSVY